MRARFFGQYLVARGVITAPQLLAAVEYQTRNNSRLGELAVALGLTTPFEVEQIRAFQATEDLRFGEAALRLGVLAPDEIERAAVVRETGHVQLGEALIALGYVQQPHVEQAAAAFMAAEAELAPEVVTIPADLPYREIAFELFHLAHKLLLRVCDLTSKTERLRVMRDVFSLSDRNARVAISGAVQSSVLLCLPDAIAFDVAARFSGELAPDDDAIDSIVAELANLLCGNLQSLLDGRGTRVEAARAARVAARLSMPPGSCVALVPFLTHRGQVLVGLSLPPEA